MLNDGHGPRGCAGGSSTRVRMVFSVIYPVSLSFRSESIRVYSPPTKDTTTPAQATISVSRRSVPQKAAHFTTSHYGIIESFPFVSDAIFQWDVDWAHK